MKAVSSRASCPESTRRFASSLRNYRSGQEGSRSGRDNLRGDPLSRAAEGVQAAARQPQPGVDVAGDNAIDRSRSGSLASPTPSLDRNANFGSSHPPSHSAGPQLVNKAANEGSDLASSVDAVIIVYYITASVTKVRCTQPSILQGIW